jgi:Patatin-like phospholipase
MLWRKFLARYSQGHDALFDNAFLERWGKEKWNPNAEDENAAAKLHVQMVSRITTQQLGYLEGVEKTALKSVYDLFEHTRTICTVQCGARHFSILAWHVLNTHVRPFTAKWHPVSERGMLSALDTTDEFRAELEALQGLLRHFAILLAHLRDGKPPPATTTSGETARQSSIIAEMERSVPWGIPSIQGGIDQREARKINEEEEKAIRKRREHYNCKYLEKTHAVGLALSGGGIRSATLSLGVLIALARRGLLPQFDYLSTVSGGGYLGSFLTAFLNSAGDREIGLRSDELPFRREGGEAEALRHIRHHSKYLASGRISDRLRMIAAQLYGMVLNGVGVMFLAAIVAVVEQCLRTTKLPFHVWPQLIALMSVLLALWAFIALVLGRRGQRSQKIADIGLVYIGTTLCALFVWVGLGRCHDWVASKHHWPVLSGKQLLAILGAIPLVSSAFAGVAGKILDRVKLALGILSAVAAPLFFFGIYLLLYNRMENTPVVFTVGSFSVTWIHISMVVLAIVYFALIDVNVTSPHRQYRKKLAEAYLIQRAKNPRPGQPFDEAVELKLSKANSPRAPYQLINAALNVPASKNPAMQGRLTDFFVYSCAFCGSPLTGYKPTTEWENKDGHLDLGTAMAISGAAAAPQMGLGTRRRLSFWLALLNVRLGYWVRNPAKHTRFPFSAPGLWFLLKEMLGWMDERAPWIYVSDGGHIENLGVYELLRRRCKYIVAIDGEQDQRMTFGALTTLQRLAAIDLGVKIDINLDDLRLNEQGLSRSHFRFARIHYPDKQYGYLLYVKSSLTGNEGEFLRRYRIEDPAFPHDPTADQFFSEARFEAYRSLGEHMGDKLFLRALAGEKLATSNSIEVEDWFRELGNRLLEPL